MTALTFVYLIAGLVLLVLGAESLVRGAVKLAERLGISALVIGLTVVAFGTSAPEMAVSVQASLSGSGDIAVGNVIGSNIANILLILGLSALVAPRVVSRQLVRLDVPVMLAAGVVIASKRGARSDERNSDDDETQTKPLSWLTQLFLIALGLGLLVAGSHLLIEGAVSLARALGLSELVIGLTVVAVGTSMPELATSLMAVYRGERDIAVGNVVGSCIFNLLLVLGAGAVVTTEGLSISPNALAFDFPVMLAVFGACLPIFFSGYRINRWEGAMFLGYYMAYTLYLIMFSAGLPAIELLRHAMTWYVFPLTAITVLVIFLRAWKHQR